MECDRRYGCRQTGTNTRSGHFWNSDQQGEAISPSIVAVCPKFNLPCLRALAEQTLCNWVVQKNLHLQQPSPRLVAFGSVADSSIATIYPLDKDLQGRRCKFTVIVQDMFTAVHRALITRQLNMQIKRQKSSGRVLATVGRHGV